MIVSASVICKIWKEIFVKWVYTVVPLRLLGYFISYTIYKSGSGALNIASTSMCQMCGKCWVR